MKSIYNIRITLNVSLISILFISCAQKQELSWQEIADNNWNETYFIKENEVKDRDTLIVYLTTGYYYERLNEPEVQRILELRNDKVFKEPFDPLLALLYYYNHVNTEEIKDNPKLLEVLLKFTNKDKSNALPYYLLHYYYAVNMDQTKSIEYLKEGNSINTVLIYYFIII